MGATPRKPWQRATDDRPVGGYLAARLTPVQPGASEVRHQAPRLLRSAQQLEAKLGRLSRRQWIKARKAIRRAARAKKWEHLERRGDGRVTPKRFVKSASTSTPVERSRAELEKLVMRYGCSSFASQMDYEAGQITVTFIVPDTPEKGAAKIPVQLEVSIRDVYDALYGRPTKWGQTEEGRYGHSYNPAGYSERGMEQARRVAWRQLILWVDAALSAASAGVQKVSEAFFAHTLIQTNAGEVIRVVDQVNRIAGGNWKALLPSRAGC